MSLIHCFLLALTLAAPRAMPKKQGRSTATIETAVNALLASTAESGSTCIDKANPKTPLVASAAIPISFLNTMTVSVSVCWSDFSGNLVHYYSIEPNQQKGMNTFAGHIWNFRANDGSGCNGKALTKPVSFASAGVKDIGEVAKTCTAPPAVIPDQSKPPVEGPPKPPKPTEGEGAPKPTTPKPAEPKPAEPTPKPTTPTGPSGALVIDDYKQLEASLKNNFVNAANIPKIVRMAFHDLANFDPENNPFGGPNGCIFTETVSGFDENNGLESIGKSISGFVKTNFPTKNFPMGDVVSLAGKVAAETAFGVSIPWKFGRAACNQDAVSEDKELGPTPFIETMDDMRQFLTRYSLTALEMAILTSGGHAIAGSMNAAADTKIPTFFFTPRGAKTSGPKFIADSQNPTLINSFSKLRFGSTEAIGRLMSDMLFFPTTVNKIRPGKGDSKAVPIEKALNAMDESEFNSKFAAAFSKMLQIGVDPKTLVAYN